MNEVLVMEQIVDGVDMVIGMDLMTKLGGRECLRTAGPIW